MDAEFEKKARDTPRERRNELLSVTISSIILVCRYTLYLLITYRLYVRLDTSEWCRD